MNVSYTIVHGFGSIWDSGILKAAGGAVSESLELFDQMEK